ncbi:MAG TPA: DUF1684 domain-containing protein [Candidatus Acidoferrales bacterium]|nr:DUF1684 domain-containing protein [Candidatus Acidoferrales bacterium]
MNPLVIGPLLLALNGGIASHAAPPQALDPAARDSITSAILTERENEENDLKSGATSYLATIERVDFGERSALVVGRAPDCDVRIDDPAMPLHAIRVSAAGDSFHVATLDPTAPFRWQHLDYLELTLGPAAIELGRWTLRLSHQRFPAIIVFDPQSPRFSAYKGREYFPVDLSLRFAAALVPAPHPDTVIILSTRGNRRRALRVGWFDVRIGRHDCRLEAHRLLEPGVDENSLSIFFRDATTGHETYPVGRYLDPEPMPDGRYVLDFNFAYNPACAFSPHYNCPIPTRANTLPLAVRAGEMDAHYPH